jgi:hypothetical protein
MSKQISITRLVALGLAVMLPASASAGPLREAARKASHELAMAQAQTEQPGRSRGRFWTSLALIAGGGALAIIGGIELADGDSGPDEDMDQDDLPGTDDGDGAEKVMLAGGIAAAGAGAILLMTGDRNTGQAIAMRGGRLTVRHTIRF